MDLKGLSQKHFTMLKKAGHFPREIIKQWEVFVAFHHVQEHQYEHAAYYFARRMLGNKNDLLPTQDWRPKPQTVERLRSVGVPETELTPENIGILVQWWVFDVQGLATLPIYFENHFFNFVIHRTTVDILGYSALISRSIRAFDAALPEGKQLDRAVYQGFMDRIPEDGHRLFTLIQWYEYTLAFLFTLGYEGLHATIVGPPSYEPVNTDDHRAWPSEVTPAVEQGVLDCVKHYGVGKTADQNREWYYQTLDRLADQIAMWRRA